MASAGFLSTSIFRIRTWSPSCAATSFNIGGIMRQGPHHSAEKSIRTGLAPAINAEKLLIGEGLGMKDYGLGMKDYGLRIMDEGLWIKV